MPTSIPMLTRLRRLILSGGTSSAPVAVASSVRSALSALPWCFTPVVSPSGSAAGWTTGITSADAVLPERLHRGGDRALVADDAGRQHQDRGVVAVEPVLLAAGVGVAEVVERDRAVGGHEDAQRIEVAVADPRVVEAVDLCPDRGEDVVGHLFGGELGQGVPTGGSVTSSAASAPPTPVRTSLAAWTSGALGEHQRVGDVLDLLDPAAEHRHARLVVHHPVPHLGRDAGVALVAAERVDAQRARPT